jgi:hypothetical protein
MGLSDGERNDKVIWAIHRIHQIAERMPHHFSTEKLREVALTLWPALLAGSKNGMHWIMGSSSTSDRVGENGVFECAMKSVRDKFLPKDEQGEFDEKFKEIERDRELFHPSAVKLLARNPQSGGEALSCAFDIYRWTEQYFYAANRYQDDFAESLRPVSEKMALIQGLMFPLMAKGTSVAKAWMLENILNRYVQHTSGREEDLLYTWYKNEGLHHDMGIDLIDPTELYNEFKALQKMEFEDVTYEKRLLFMLKVADRRFHYEHQHKKLLDYLVKNKDKMKVNITKVKAALKKCSDAYAKYDKERKENGYDRFCYFTES